MGIVRLAAAILLGLAGIAPPVLSETRSQGEEAQGE